MDLSAISNAIRDGDFQAVAAGVKMLLEAGVSSGDILNQAMVPAMSEVGDLFERGEFYIPEMLIAARAMKAGMEVLRPHLVSSGVQPAGRVALGTVSGDIHDIGKNLVAMMLEGGGFEVIDLGVDVPPERFVQAVREGAGILGLSGLLTTTITNMPAVLQALEQAGIRGQVRVMVGGAPVTAQYAQSIGADGYAPDASQAVKLAKSFL